MPSSLGTLEYLAEVAKDWSAARFAAAQSCDFVLVAHRFVLAGVMVACHQISPDSPEALSPLDTVRSASEPTAWTHSTVVTVLADASTGTLEYEQEVVEILVMDRDDVLAEAAVVVRIAGFPPCLGPFQSPGGGRECFDPADVL